MRHVSVMSFAFFLVVVLFGLRLRESCDCCTMIGGHVGR